MVIDRFAWKEGGRWVHLPPSNGHIEPDGSFVEREYQAYAKTTDPEWREKILACTQPFGPYGSKRLGQSAPLRADHQDVKFPVMALFVTRKFHEHPSLAGWLRDTGTEMLIEGNAWHDNIWGDCRCGRPACAQPGANWLGLILMTVRAGLPEEP